MRPTRGRYFQQDAEGAMPLPQGRGKPQARGLSYAEKHFDGLGFKKDARDDPKKEKNDDKDDDKNNDGFPAVHDCYMIYGGPSTQLIARQRKREQREVFAARMAVP